MATEFQNFNRGAGGTLNLLFLVVGLVACLAVLRRRLPASQPSLRDHPHRLSCAATMFMWVISVFLNFSPASQYSIFLGYLAIIGIYAFQSTHPYFFALYTATVFYNLVQFPTLYGVIQSDCIPTFGNEDFCGSRWQTFLTFLFILYEFAAMATAFASFLAFIDTHSNRESSGESLPTSMPASATAPARSAQSQYYAPTTQPTSYTPPSYQQGGYQSLVNVDTAPSGPQSEYGQQYAYSNQDK